MPDGQLVIAFDTGLAPTYFDPAETTGIATPFVFLYAMHDALLKPLPGNDMAPCLAESWSESPDGLVAGDVCSGLRARYATWGRAAGSGSRRRVESTVVFCCSL
jgi:ABC-type transport system substrate-binding protein